MSASRGNGQAITRPRARRADTSVGVRLWIALRAASLASPSTLEMSLETSPSTLGLLPGRCLSAAATTTHGTGSPISSQTRNRPIRQRKTRPGVAAKRLRCISKHASSGGSLDVSRPRRRGPRLRQRGELRHRLIGPTEPASDYTRSCPGGSAIWTLCRNEFSEGLLAPSDFD